MYQLHHYFEYFLECPTVPATFICCQNKSSIHYVLRVIWDLNLKKKMTGAWHQCLKKHTFDFTLTSLLKETTHVSSSHNIFHLCFKNFPVKPGKTAINLGTKLRPARIYWPVISQNSNHRHTLAFTCEVVRYPGSLKCLDGYTCIFILCGDILS